jgi:hypothetical protein
MSMRGVMGYEWCQLVREYPSWAVIHLLHWPKAGHVSAFNKRIASAEMRLILDFIIYIAYNLEKNFIDNHICKDQSPFPRQCNLLEDPGPWKPWTGKQLYKFLVPRRSQARL